MDVDCRMESQTLALDACMSRRQWTGDGLARSCPGWRWRSRGQLHSRWRLAYGTMTNAFQGRVAWYSSKPEAGGCHALYPARRWSKRTGQTRRVRSTSHWYIARYQAADKEKNKQPRRRLPDQVSSGDIPAVPPAPIMFMVVRLGLRPPRPSDRHPVLVLDMGIR